MATGWAGRRESGTAFPAKLGVGVVGLATLRAPRCGPASSQTLAHGSRHRANAWLGALGHVVEGIFGHGSRLPSNVAGEPAQIAELGHHQADEKNGHSEEGTP